MEPGTSPRKVTSKRTIKYRKSRWTVHSFEVWSGELVCRMVSIKMEDSLLLWVNGGGEPTLGAVALGLPSPRLAERALATRLLAGAGEAEALAMRAAAALGCPAFVCSAMPLDRFNAPLVERGLATVLMNRPEFIHSLIHSKKLDKAGNSENEDVSSVCAKTEGENIVVGDLQKAG